MKTLFILIKDCGDGSYHTGFTFNKDWIEKQESLYRQDKLDYRSIGVDGDGFHYQKLTVPDECTLKTLGIYFDCAQEEDEDG